MNAARLLALYERIAEAPDAVGRLRRFVLDLAVRGKLVPQDTADEPAAELLKRIARERAQLTKGGEIRKPKPVPPLEEVPFELPDQWRWTRIRDVTSDRGQVVPEGEFTYIDVTAIDKEKGIVAEPKVLAAAEAPSRARKITRKHDVIYSCVRPYLLNVAVIEEDFEPPPIASTAFAVLNGYGLVLPRYIWIALRSPFLVECVEATQRGQAYPAINDADFALLPFPLPPLAEQHRIVAKVDELMALCDRLEAARTAREASRDRLAAASLARLNTPDPETFPADTRFALNALPALTTRPDPIKRLRQTILNLAVRGKLVPQDPNDEPAALLLGAIRAARRAQIAKSMMRAEKKDSGGASGLFNPPHGWTWVLADSLWDLENGDRSSNYPSRDQLVETGVPFVNAGHLVNGLVALEGMNFITRQKFDSLGGGKLRRGDQLYCLRGSLGKHAIYEHDQDAAIASSLVILRPVMTACVPYLALYLDCDVAATMLRRFDNGSAQPNLSSANLRKYEVPLPPLAEQHRIVAKVNELMALCDRLEASLNTGSAARIRLLEATLAEALALPSVPGPAVKEALLHDAL